MYISASQLDRFFTCPLLYKATYIDRIIPFHKSPSMVEGILFHKAMELAIRHQDRYFYKSKQGLYEMGITFDKAHDGLTSAEYVQPMLDRLDALIEGGLRSFNLQSMSNTEMKVYFHVYGIQYFGIIDALKDNEIIIDFKTGLRYKTQRDIDNSMQMVVYAAAINDMRGRPLEYPVEVQYISVSKNDPGHYRIVKRIITAEDIYKLLALSMALKEAIRTDKFYPTSPAKCPQWCPLRKNGECGVYIKKQKYFPAIHSAIIPKD